MQPGSREGLLSFPALSFLGFHPCRRWPLEISGPALLLWDAMLCPSLMHENQGSWHSLDVQNEPGEMVDLELWKWTTRTGIIGAEAGRPTEESMTEVDKVSRMLNRPV